MSVLAMALGISVAQAHAAPAEENAVMPNLEGMTLEDAAEVVREITGDPDVTIHTGPAKGWNKQQLAWSMWEVCWQAPEAGKELNEKSLSWIGFGVTRRGTDCY